MGGASVIGEPKWLIGRIIAFLETQERVKENFTRYGLLDEQVRFVKGWFRDTLGHSPIEQLAVLRLDGDLYESTIQALDGLYHKLSPGGFVIVDDYGNVRAWREAVNGFRPQHGISDKIVAIDWGGVYRRLSSLPVKSA